jgi:hypothetical protein
MITLPPLSEWNKGDHAYWLARGGVELKLQDYGIGRSRWGASVTYANGQTSIVTKSGKSYAFMAGRASDAYTHATYETAGQARAALARAMQASEARRNPQETDEARRQRLPRKNPQHAFNPINYGFRWTKDWYEWDAKAATAAAKRDRDAEAKRLQAQGYTVRKWSNARQLVRRGGIGSGHPEIDEVVTVFMLDVR